MTDISVAVILVIAMIFVFQGKPNIYDLAHAKVVLELSK